MHTQPNHHVTSRLLHLSDALDEFDPWSHLDFDNADVELEREIAELRLQLTNH